MTIIILVVTGHTIMKLPGQSAPTTLPGSVLYYFVGDSASTDKIFQPLSPATVHSGSCL